MLRTRNTVVVVPVILELVLVELMLVELDLLVVTVVRVLVELVLVRTWPRQAGVASTQQPTMICGRHDLLHLKGIPE